MRQPRTDGCFNGIKAGLKTSLVRRFVSFLLLFRYSELLCLTLDYPQSSALSRPVVSYIDMLMNIWVYDIANQLINGAA